MGIPSRGLVNYPQVSKLYDEIGMSGQVSLVNRPNFGRKLFSEVASDLSSIDQLKIKLDLVRKNNSSTAINTLAEINDWLINLVVKN
jgi:hypothetical protein